MRIFLLLFAALIAAAATGFYALQGLRAPAPATTAEAPVEAPKPVNILVAARDLSIGTLLQPSDLGRMPIAPEAITPEMILADDAGETLLVGSVVLQTLAKSLPIGRSATAQPGDRGFLAAVLPKGKRAVSIQITDVSGLSGLVLPGDHVDLILTYSVTAEMTDAKRDIHASETVVRNLRVLALDQRLGKPAAGDDALPIAQTATLEVTPDEAETITLATTLGQLSLVLNSIRDGDDASNDRADDQADDQAGATTSPLVETMSNKKTSSRDSGGRMGAIRPRKMTLDSEVTTLLNRANDDKVETRLRATPIQVVRGRVSASVIYGGDKPAGDAPAKQPAPPTPPVEN